MDSVTPAGDTPASPLPGQGQSGSPEQQGQYSAADVEGLRALVESQAKQLQGQSAALGKLTRMVESFQKPTPPPEGTAPEPAVKADPMVSRYQELDKVISQQKRAATLSAFRNALTSAGIDDEAAREYSRWLARDHESEIQTELTEDAEYRVTIGETSVSDWIKAYVESDKGKAIRAARQKAPLPTGHSRSAEVKPSTPAKTQLTHREYSVKVAEAVARGRAEGKNPSEFLKGFELLKE